MKCEGQHWERKKYSGKKNNLHKCQEIRVYMAHPRNLGGAGVVHEDINDQVLSTVLNGYDRYNLLDVKIMLLQIMGLWN